MWYQFYCSSKQYIKWNLDRGRESGAPRNLDEQTKRGEISTVKFSSGGSRISRRGWGLSFGNIFAENCMKMKEIGLRGGARVTHAPLRTATVFIYIYFKTFVTDFYFHFWNHRRLEFLFKPIHAEIQPVFYFLWQVQGSLMVAALFEVFLGATGAVGGLLRFIGELHLSTSTFIYL